MAKFFGNIGFESLEETAPGIYTSPEIVEKPYCGDVINFTRRLQNSGEINDSITLSNKISIICDAYANQNFHRMKYVEYMGAKWKISYVEAQYPRLILTFGDLYND